MGSSNNCRKESFLGSIISVEYIHFIRNQTSNSLPQLFGLSMKAKIVEIIRTSSFLHQIRTNVNSLVGSGDDEFGKIGELEGVCSQVIGIAAKYNQSHDRSC